MATVREDLFIDYLPIGELIPYAKNSRTHSEPQVAQIAASIKEFGWTNPVLIDSDNGIIAGHGRVLAGYKLGYTEAPVIKLPYLTETQKKAYIIADNRLALSAGWDEEMLSIELKELEADGFDLELTGFSSEELDAYLEESKEDSDSDGGDDEDSGEPDESIPPISKLGDVWLLGRHRLMCGSSTDINDIETLLDGNSADMIYTDPPYGVSIVKGGSVGGGESYNIPFGGVKNESGASKKKRLGSVGGGKIAKVGRYEPIAGDDTIDVAVAAIGIIKTLGADVEIIWGGNYYASYLDNSSCWIVWDKQNTGNFADAELAWTNQNTATRIFAHMWNGMIKASEHGEKRVHPTQKPVALAEWCFEKYGEDCNTVLDMFGGSGSTLMACESMGKTGYIMELSTAYVDVIVNRWQNKTGGTAIHAVTGEAFSNG